MPERFTGAAIERLSDARLLIGEGRYISDVSTPDMAWAAVVRSTHAHARVHGVDVTGALQEPEVVAVLTADDLGTVRGDIPSFGQFPPALRDRWQPVIRDTPMKPLAREKVRYVGEPIAVVIAGTRYAAEDAAELVAVDYEPLGAVPHVERALEPDAPLLFDELPDNVAMELRVGVGDADAAFANAPVVVGDRFRSQRYTGVPLESRGMLVQPLPDGGLDVRSSHQMAHYLRDLICTFLDIPEALVRCRQTDIGGGFGPKAGFYPEDVVIPFAARMLDRPVKWLEDKREHLMACSHSREQRFDAELALAADGTILGLRYAVVLDAGAYLTMPIVLPYVGLTHFLGPYRVPALGAHIRSVVTNKATSAPSRGAGRPEVAFVLNRLVDMAAAELGLDPIELRRRNLRTPSELPHRPGILYRDGNPLEFDSGDYPAALERCAAAIGYEAFREQQRAARRGPVYRGVGLSCNVESTGIGPFEGARVRVDVSGTVFVDAGVVDSGQSHATVFAQVCADVMSVTPGDVVVRTGDTDGVAYGMGSYHSRAAVTAGNAVRLAAVRARAKVLAVAGHLLDVLPSELEIVDGRVRAAGTAGLGLSLADCARAADPLAGLPPGLGPGIDESDYWRTDKIAWGNAAHAAIVAVDSETGVVEIERYVVVHDCGRLLNPTVVDGQIAGGVVAGIGGALHEHLQYSEDGQPLTTTFMDYRLPALDDVPELQILHLESPSPTNPLGVKGVGEGGTIGPPAVVCAAVEDALTPLGVRLRATPLSPSAVLSAIESARG